MNISISKKVIVSSVKIRAKNFNGKDSSIYNVTTTANTTGKTQEISATSFTWYSWTDLDNGKNNKSSTITLKGSGGSQRIYVAEIDISYKVSDKLTVSFDYKGAPNYSNSSVEVTSGSFITNPIDDEATYTDWDGTYLFMGWYTDLSKDDTEFDFNTAVTTDLNLYAKWELYEDSESVTNIKKSETKAQLYYKYKEGAEGDTTTGTITFGTERDESDTTKASTWDCYTSDNMPSGSSIVFDDSCYIKNGTDSTKYALRLNNSRSTTNGSFEINFSEEIVIKSVVVSIGKQYGDSDNTFKVSSSACPNGKTNKATNNSTFKNLTFSQLDNNNSDTSSYLKFENTTKGRTYISSIKINYIQPIKSDEPVYTISDIGLRFGGAVKKEYYEAIGLDHISKVGMVYTTDPTSLEDFQTNLKNDSYTPKQITVSNSVKPALQTLSDGEQYYVFNIFINVSTASIEKEVYAAAQMTLTNGESFYFSETHYSVKTIAQAYLDKADAGYSDPVKATLELLAAGKTKTEVTTESN